MLTFTYNAHNIKNVSTLLKKMREKIKSKPYAPKISLLLQIQEIEHLLDNPIIKEEQDGF